MKHPMLQVVDARPPNYDKILAACPDAARPGVIFAYAPHVYMPGAWARGVKVLTRELDAHERVHIERQGSDPAGWWDKYLADVSFRFIEELVAHQAEYETYKKRHLDPVKRHEALLKIAGRLSSSLYGNLAPRDTMVKMILTLKEAKPLAVAA